jgi:hypothetical protein
VTAGVDFVLVGALAAVAHGSAVVTHDFRITYAPDPANLDRLRDVLTRLDARLRGVAAAIPFDPDDGTLRGPATLTVDTPDGSIDLVGQGDHSGLRERAEAVQIAGVDVLVASLDDLIAMKKAAGRPKDLVALEELEAIKRLRRELG